MGKRTKLNTFGIVCGIISFASFIGTISGTLSWWAYSTRTSLFFDGTSVYSSELLQVGIRTSYDLTPVGLEHERISGVDYHFAKVGAGLHSTAIKYYLQHATDYADVALSPVTSGKYDFNDNLTLYNQIMKDVRFNDTIAEHEKYIKLPLVFRIIRIDAIDDDSKYSQGKHIWLTGAEAAARSSSDGEVFKALRLHADGYVKDDEHEDDPYLHSQFIINPSSELTREQSALRHTNVAGLLDMDKDEMYDHFTNGTHEEELIYGQYQVLSPTASLVPTSDELDDINGTNKTDNSTFLAKHMPGVYGYTSLNDFRPETAEFETIDSMKPDNNEGRLSGGVPLCTTVKNSTGLANLDLTIWIEGWDHTVVDEEEYHYFNLGLTFQIDRKSDD